MVNVVAFTHCIIGCVICIKYNDACKTNTVVMIYNGSLYIEKYSAQRMDFKKILFMYLLEFFLHGF